MNEKRDPVPDEGISLLQFLYREEFTPLAAKMMTEFGTMKYARGACQGDEKELEQIDQEYQAPIARIIDAEIEYQKWLSESEAEWAAYRRATRSRGPVKNGGGSLIGFVDSTGSSRCACR